MFATCRGSNVAVGTSSRRFENLTPDRVVPSSGVLVVPSTLTGPPSLCVGRDRPGRYIWPFPEA